MKVVSGKKLCVILEKNGWCKKYIKGSHHIYMKPGRRERISVPVHGNADLKKGMLKTLLKMAGIEEDEL
jgi:predicted RNA binding protein YcfA (HicA-like mRNA interferase family)